jgi:uncharacterized protein
MKIVDINILIYAINIDAPLHSKIKTWWESAVMDEESIGLPWTVILGFIRIVTNTRIMPKALSPDGAIELVDEWLSLPGVSIIHPRENHWNVLRELLGDRGTAANLTTDAHLAALAIEYGAKLYSADNDFSRFKKLRWVDPGNS